MPLLPELRTRALARFMRLMRPKTLTEPHAATYHEGQRSKGMASRSAGSVTKGRATERDTLALLADVVVQHLHDVSVAAGEAGFLVTLPTYLDETELSLLQLEVNRRSATYVKLEHRPGERRVGV